MKKNYEEILQVITELEESKKCRCENWDVSLDGVNDKEEIEDIRKLKQECFIATADTFLGMDWNELILILSGLKFQCGFSQCFIGDNYKIENEVIYFNHENGLIIYADSYRGETVNSVKVYGEAKIFKGKLTEEQMQAMIGLSYRINVDGYMSFSFSGLQGLKFYLNRLLDLFECSNRWNNVQYLDFLNYTELKKSRLNYAPIIYYKLNNSVKELQDIISFK